MTPSSTSSSRWVPSTPPRGIVLGHNPSCKPAMTTRSHSCPSAACALSTLTCCAPSDGLGGDARQLQRRDVLDESAQRRTGRARHVLIGDVEQRGHRVEIPGGLGAARAAALAGRQPAPLQTGPLPRRPQGVARILAVAIAAGGRVQHRTHPPQRAGLRSDGALPDSASTSRSPKLSGRTNGLGALQCSAQLAQRDRVDAADGPGQQRQRPCTVKPVGGGGQHREQRVRRGFLGQRARRTRVGPPELRRRPRPAAAARRPAPPSGRSPPSATTAPRRSGGHAAARRRSSPPPRAPRRPAAR